MAEALLTARGLTKGVGGLAAVQDVRLVLWRERSHAVMIGCAIEHAHRFAYADSLSLTAAQHAVPIGITCRQCAREDCSQRAFDRVVVPGAARPRPPSAVT